MFRGILLLISAVVLSTSAQIFVQQPQPVVAHLAHPELAHPAVIQKDQWESQLPPELQKSARFYSNPKTAAALAASSWFSDTENPVFSREAENIDRGQISKIFHNSGLMGLMRRR